MNPRVGGEPGGFSHAPPPAARESQSGASEVSDWPAVQRGLALRQAGNSAVMGFSSSCHPAQALPGPLLDTAGRKELLAVLSAHPRVLPAELLAAVSAVSVLLCPWSSCSLVFEKFP